MAAYDRDATLERKQIREISRNVARRLHQILDRAHYVPAALRPEVDSTVHVITGIQRDVEQIMSSLPPDEALDFAILTHIMGGQRHALDLLEILEEKLAGPRNAYQRDSQRVHQALLAVSREIEQDALRYAGEPARPRAAAPSPAGYAFAPPAAAGQAYPQPPPPAYGSAPATAPRPSAPKSPPASKNLPVPKSSPAPAPARKTKQPSLQPADIVARLRTAALAGVTKPVPVALAALAVGAGLVVAAQSLTGDNLSEQRATSTEATETKRDGRLASTEMGPMRTAGETVIAAAPAAMEQPYLVVLSTRRSTEELQQDYRSFKGAYPNLLGNAKARVDRVQGQDRQTWYRLSLIPPRTHDDAKTLCNDLRSAGLTGCWIRPVPVQ
ncbi:hypothetical protein [Hyphomicrobium sp. CS1GBMeth3]|uniref:hypothetical protein n=1 Tax=Hyphomicrobium sp. CS1GBMeth3 TaxID=1892845 RepID=UPI00093081AE|nr:hypothetical protein [Hyphomicrobium sp. CS1GBMeth3]